MRLCCATALKRVAQFAPILRNGPPAFAAGSASEAQARKPDLQGISFPMDASVLLGILYVGVRLALFAGIVYVAVSEILRERRR